VATRSTSAPVCPNTSSTWRDGGASSRSRRVALEQAGRGQHVAQGDARVAAQHDLPHGLATQLSRGSHLTVLVHDQRIDGRQVDGQHLFARCAGIGHQRAVCLRTALIAQEHLGLVVTDEHRRGGANLVGDTAEHRTLAYRQQASAGPRELEHDRGLMLRLDPSNDLAQVAAQQLECHVAGAHERTGAAREVDLDAARRPQPDVTGGHRLAELRGRHDHAQHAHAADRRQARVVGQRQARRRRKALDVHGRRKADPGTGDEYAVVWEARGHRFWSSGLLSHLGVVRGHRPTVVGDGHFGRSLLHAHGQRLGHGARRRSRQDDLVDLHTYEVVFELRVLRSSGENLLGHRARRIPGSCSHGSIVLLCPYGPWSDRTQNRASAGQCRTERSARRETECRNLVARPGDGQGVSQRGAHMRALGA
jgi:hypothetical protein